jgi:hypothetical protein
VNRRRQVEHEPAHSHRLDEFPTGEKRHGLHTVVAGAGLERGGAREPGFIKDDVEQTATEATAQVAGTHDHIEAKLLPYNSPEGGVRKDHRRRLLTIDGRLVKRATAPRLLTGRRPLPGRWFVSAVRIRLDEKPSCRLEVTTPERSIVEHRQHRLGINARERA